jgi:hypothetical protein
MSRRFAGALGLAMLLVGFTPCLALAQANGPSSRKEAKALAERLDKIINQRLVQEKVKPGPKADDAQFARRLHIDLAGKIPSLLEIKDYLENDSSDRLDDRLDELLESPQFIANWSYYWRSVMLSGTNNVQAFQFQFQFEGWLRDRLSKNVGYDKIAHELVSSQPFNGQQQQNGPAAFYFVNENKPENLAGSTARVFLGVKIECAQCHKHPFASWTRDQFWEYAAFFAGINQGNRPQPKGGKQPDANQRSIKIPETDKVVQAKFITGEVPAWQSNSITRTVLADWMISPKNPYFAKAAVDHVWQYFFGVSLMEPIFEPTDTSPPAHPDLLEELARSFVESGYDLKHLIRAIVQTEAYQRQSVALNADNLDQIQLFSRMPVRGMMPEQLFDSFAEATDYRQQQNLNNNMQFNQFGLPDGPRATFLARFTTQDKRIETQTSILQALYLMNGKFLADRVRVDNNKSLETIATAPTTTARRVETLYLMVLSRMPRPEETAKLVAYIDRAGQNGGQAQTTQAVADIYWALLNSSEFMLNH